MATTRARTSAILKKERFQGCLVGAAIGDCLGALFEGVVQNEGIPKKNIFLRLKLDEHGDFLPRTKKEAQLNYTDDTAMTRSVSLSLLECKSFDSVNMADRFCKAYYKEQDRGYGGGVIKIFSDWRLKKITKSNVLIPSKTQFEGSGSYGNGAAMRVSPVGLFASSLTECVKLAEETAILTHSHKYGKNGAILQAMAVFKALHTDGVIKPVEFLKDLQEEMAKLEGCCISEENGRFQALIKKRLDNYEDTDNILYEWTRSDDFTFTHQLCAIETVLNYYEKNPTENSIPDVISNIGADVSAMQAVPAAILCFLKNVNRSFQDVLYYAISLGDDTDTIASMACAIAGAYHGTSVIPKSWIDTSEGTQEMLEFGEQFYKLSLE